MNKYCFIVLFSLFFSCRNLLNQRASWDFMQEADFRIESPYRYNDEYYLPFTCDLNKFNSAPLAIIKSKIKKDTDEISFYLIYTLNEKENINSINLGKINNGIYDLYYIDKNMGKIFIDKIIIK